MTEIDAASALPDAFSDIPVFGAMRRVYALMIFYGVILVRLAALPLAGLVIVTIGFDLIVLALGAQVRSQAG